MTIDQMKQTQERALLEREKQLARRERDKMKVEREKIKIKGKWGIVKRIFIFCCRLLMNKYCMSLNCVI